MTISALDPRRSFAINRGIVSARRRYLVLTAASLLACCLASCQLATGIEIFNNTQQSIRIEVDEDVLKLKPGESAKIFERQLHRFWIEINDAWLEYASSTTIPPSFTKMIGRSGWEKPWGRAQIESDGRIWLLAPDQAFPANRLPDQPSGFPLSPITVSDE